MKNIYLKRSLTTLNIELDGYESAQVTMNTLTSEIIIITDNIDHLLELQKLTGKYLEINGYLHKIRCAYPDGCMFNLMMTYNLYSDLMKLLITEHHHEIYSCDFGSSFNTIARSGWIGRIYMNTKSTFHPTVLHGVPISCIIESIRTRESKAVIKNRLALKLVQLSGGLKEGDAITLDGTSSHLDYKFIKELFSSKLIISKHAELLRNIKHKFNSLSKKFFIDCAINYNYNEEEMKIVTDIFLTYDKLSSMPIGIIGDVRKKLELNCMLSINEKINLLNHNKQEFNRLMSITFVDVELLAKYYNSENNDTGSIISSLYRTGLFNLIFPDMKCELGVDIVRDISCDRAIRGYSKIFASNKMSPLFCLVELIDFMTNDEIESMSKIVSESKINSEAWNFIINLDKMIGRKIKNAMNS